VNAAVAAAAALALAGGIAQPADAGYCLRFVREVVEHAFEWPDRELYARCWTRRVEENATAEPWARDLERSLRERGYAVTVPRAGDLVFDFTYAPVGHVGVMLTDDMVLDVYPVGGVPTLRLTPVAEWLPTTIIRLPADACG